MPETASTANVGKGPAEISRAPESGARKIPHMAKRFRMPARSAQSIGWTLVLGWLLGVVLPTKASAQDLSPRAYWPAPVGTRVLVLGYQYSSGDVLSDISLPVYGVDSKIHTGLAGYVQTFDFLGRTTNVQVELPYSTGTTKGLLFGMPARRDFSGFNDASIRVSVNLRGAPAMTPADFQELRADPRPIVGASLKVVAPSGRYDVGRLINVGGNRWAAKFELGVIAPLKPRWLLEVDAGFWLFGDDPDFISGTREQDAIYALQAHLVYRVRPGLWMSLDGNWFTGGQQTIGGHEQDDKQRNTRLGINAVFPFARRHAIRFGYSKGVRTRFGNDFDLFLVSYQRLLGIKD